MTCPRRAAAIPNWAYPDFRSYSDIYWNSFHVADLCYLLLLVPVSAAVEVQCGEARSEGVLLFFRPGCLWFNPRREGCFSSDTSFWLSSAAMIAR